MLLNPNKLLCLVRKIEVQKTPEELVRQNILDAMLSALGFPQALIVIEKKLSELHLAHSIPKKIPNRRIDILCYAKGAALEPLLLVECKAKLFGDKELRQLLGYNYHIGAHFVALVSEKKVLLASRDGKKQFNTLLSYTELLSLA